MTTAIWIALIILSIFFIYVLSKDVIKHQKVLENVSVVKTALIGFVVNCKKVVLVLTTLEETR